MSQHRFLEGILPEGTRYSLRIIKKSTGSAFNRFYSSVDEMTDEIQTYVDNGYDVYYVTAGFGAGQTATSDNAVAKRELYIDVDCGPTKPYLDKNEGAQALKEFCKATNLPRPTVVDSGNGLHAHWIFFDAVPVHAWIEVASGLKALCKEHNFQADPVCTADAVRVLRVPETINSKNGSTVTLLTPIIQYDFEQLKKTIGAPAIFAFDKAKSISKTSPSSLTKSLSGGDPNRISKFEIIWAKSVKGNGCAQIQNAIEQSDTLPEPVWRGVLSVAQHCEDRDWAIHAVSEKHPNYSMDETERKALGTKGPYTCETFQGMETASLCAGCPHSGKITSPIQLGATIKVAPPGPAEVVIAEKKFEIPAYPWPYYRGAHGGVYTDVMVNEEKKVEVVYPYDLYVYKRMRESELGDVVWLRHHLPNDAVRDFMIPQKDIGALDKFRDKLSSEGVAVFAQAQLVKLQTYVGKSIQELQIRMRADEVHTRFGWTKNGTFIVGDREYTKNGVVTSPVGKTAEKYAPWFIPRGSLERWKEIANAYNDPRFDLHAFGLLSGFGSVLMALSPENGAVINYYSKRSGTGKTTILRMVNSIFGDPKAMMKDAQDTHMTKVHRMGMWNGIAMCLDEMTNATPEEISALLYGSTQGRARDRMEAGRNAERMNDITWKGTAIWSTNANLEDQLSKIKVDPQGEMARTIEIFLQTPVPRDVLETQRVFNGLADNYGHAGDAFLKYVIPHLEEVQAMWLETQEAIYSKGSWTQTERYRLNAVICAVTAGVILQNLGLLSFNVTRVARKVIRLVSNAGAQMLLQATKATESIASFVNKNVNNMLIVDAKSRANGLQNQAYVKPKGQLVIRYEPDTKILFIVQKDFNRWCVEQYINTRELPDLFETETGHKLEVVKKRMGSGWDADFGAVNAYCIKDAEAVLGFQANDIIATSEET